MAKSSRLVIGAVIAGMVGAAASAAVNADPFGSAPVSRDKGLMILAANGYGPVPTQFDTIPLGEGQVPPPPVFDRFNARRALQDAAALSAATTTPVTAPAVDDIGALTPIVSLGNETLDCTLAGAGTRTAVPLDRLVSAIRTGVDGLGPKPSVDLVRALIQGALNRSGDGLKLKIAAIQTLKGSFAPGSAGAQAVTKPFDLYDEGVATVPGYDPCGNPAAIGGSAFGTGAFAGDFATINPPPVVASRLAAAVEGS